MAIMMIDDDDDNVKIEKEDSDTAYIKNTIKQGLQDIETIVDTFERLLPLVEPFGDAETIAELILLYTEVIPNILVGDYDNVLEGLSEEAEEMARVAIKHRRKDMFAKLLEKYIDQCQTSFTDYEGTVKDVADKTGTELGELALETDKVAESTD